MSNEAQDADRQGSAGTTAESFGWEDAQGPHSCAYLAPLVVRLLRSVGARRVMDLGSGNGALCVTLKAEGFEMVGVEYDAKGVQIARQTAPGIPFYNFGVQDDPEELLKHEGLFDTVVSTEVIEHLFSPEDLPSYANRCLKPGGRLIVSTPYHGYLKNLALSVFDKWDQHHTVFWKGGHIKFWSRRTLTQLLEQSGFVVEHFAGAGRVPYLWRSMVLVARKP